LSNGTRKWVTEQTSLTGGTVDIDVAEKTTLKGAVIASDTGDLTLATGSLEYSNIKDRDSSMNIGGGISASYGDMAKRDDDGRKVKDAKGNVVNEKGSDGGLSSASFGFSDNRQTNFATIGEGTIIVRSSTGSATTDLAGLNRDVTVAQYGTMSTGVQLSADKGTIDLLTNPVNTFYDTVDGLDQIADRGIKIEQQTHIVEKTDNYINYDEFGTDDNPDVERAKLSYQMNQEGIVIPANDLGFEAGQLVKSEGGQIFQIGLDEKGNRTLVDTGLNTGGYIQNVSMDGNETLAKQVAANAMDINSRYQAVHNFDSETGKTVVNGIEIDFNYGNEKSEKYNTLFKVNNVDGRVWTNVTTAANASGIDGITVYAVDYGKSEPHAAGLAIDISMVSSNGNDILYKRDYENGAYNNPVADPAITKFENSLKNDPNGTKNVWSPWTTYSENRKGWDGENMITQYPGVHDTGKVGLEQSTKFKEYVQQQNLSTDEAKRLYRGYQHTDHLHYQIEKPVNNSYIPKELQI